MKRSRRLDSTVALLQERYGARALRKGSELPQRRSPPHIPSGFPALDELTGCDGIPLGAVTLLSGRSTSGKLTVAYRVLANAQQTGRGKGASAALLDLTGTSDPDYLERCGVNLERLLIARPRPQRQAVDLLLKLVDGGRLRAVMVDSLAALRMERDTARALEVGLGRLHPLLANTRCSVICLDEPRPPWMRWLRLRGGGAIHHVAALELELRRERWLEQDGRLCGYQARVELLRSRWARSGGTARLAIEFNGAVRARETWG